MIRASVYQTSIVIETDDPTVKPMLEYAYDDEVFNFFKKRKTISKIRGKIYSRHHTDPKTRHVFYLVGLGWAAYILNTFSYALPTEDADSIKRAVFQEVTRVLPFPELYDTQNSDILWLLKYKFGLFTVYTGYGKSQCIAVLANYLLSLGKKVLLVTPSTNARNELLKRIDSLYGIKVPTKLDGPERIKSVITTGFLNRKDTKEPTLKAGLDAELASFDAVLCDEVEYCINPAGIYIFEHCSNAGYRYAFSGTADKKQGDMINFMNGLSDPTVARNKDLINYFGPSLIYRKPQGKEIDLITIYTKSLDSVKIPTKDQDSTNYYLNVMTTIFTSPEVSETLCKVIEAYPLVFIPINNLQQIIYNWIDNWWKGRFRVLLVHGKDGTKGTGYDYYALDGTRTSLTLVEACDYIKNGLVDVIPSTSSGFRALDFPCLSNILVFDGNLAGSVLQQVGRVARQDHMNIISLQPKGKKKIAIYTKACEGRKKMIESYYKYCTITDVYVDEDNLGK